jgi:hypothetical protein
MHLIYHQIQEEHKNLVLQIEELSNECDKSENANNSIDRFKHIWNNFIIHPT